MRDIQVVDKEREEVPVRAVYLLIVLSFLRRLLRRVLSPAGARLVGSGECREKCLMLTAGGWGGLVAGPFRIPYGTLDDIAEIVEVWSEELPEGMGMRLTDSLGPLDNLGVLCSHAGVESPGGVAQVRSTVTCCIMDIEEVLRR